MNKKQWGILSIMFYLMFAWFVYEDLAFGKCLNFEIEDRPLNQGDIWCVVNSEIRDPFIPALFVLGITCMICGWLEPEKKH